MVAPPVMECHICGHLQYGDVVAAIQSPVAPGSREVVRGCARCYFLKLQALVGSIPPVVPYEVDAK